ncbi:MAG: AAA family ATPase [Acidobacteria bacterium]|nr:AAA family ATPase [Acidobacteriota bacterium]
MAHRTETTDNLDLLLGSLPEHIQTSLQAEAHLQHLLEVVLDLGRRPEARFPDRTVYLDEEFVSREDIHHVVQRVGAFNSDNRAGIERTLHRISAIRNRAGEVVGLTCRVGRAVFGTVEIVRDVIESGRSVLIMGRPGVGKTTLLREAARVLADELDKRVVVVDTSNEIAGDGDVPHPGIGRARRMQVPSSDHQHAVMIEAVENHMPEVIVIDEIGTEAEATAARTIAERGVQLVATAHGNSLDNLLMNPTLTDLVGGIQPVTLGDEEARRRGTQKTVLERKAPPTFDILIEIQDKDRFAIHQNVADVVDKLLRGVPPQPEIRVRMSDGEIRVEAKPPAQETRESEPKENGRRPRSKEIRIFPYAVTRDRLERGIREVRVPACATNNLREADLVLTLKGHARGNVRKLRDAAERNLPVYAIKSNTLSQITSFLRSLFENGDRLDSRDQAIKEAEEAVLEVARRRRPVELAPQNSYLRRLQHQLIGQTGLGSESKGEEPYRRVVIFPEN